MGMYLDISNANKGENVLSLPKAYHIAKWFCNNFKNSLEGVNEDFSCYFNIKNIEPLFNICMAIGIDKNKANEMLPEIEDGAEAIYFMRNLKFVEFYAENLNNTSIFEIYISW